MTRPDPTFYRVGAVRTEDALQVESYDAFIKGRDSELRQGIQESEKTGTLLLPLRSRQYPIVRIIGRAWKWPSVIAPWQAHNPMLINQEVADALDASDLNGYRPTEVSVVGFSPIRLLLSPRPRYFAFKPVGEMQYSLRVYERFDDRYEFRFSASNFSDPRISETRKSYGHYLYRRIPIPETWDRSDFFSWAKEGQSTFGSICCTPEFLHLVRDNGFSGFTFHPLDALGESYVDVRSRTWPPSTWYPDKLLD